MNHDNHKKTAIDHALEQSTDTPVPLEVEARLRTRLAGFRQKLESQNGESTGHRRHWVLRASVGTAAVLTLGLGLWISLSPAITLADVQAAIEKRPWLHVIFDNGEEKWVSLVDHKSFYRATDGFLHFSDYTTNVRMDYWPQTGAIHKSRVVLMPPDTDPSTALKFAPQSALDIAGIRSPMAIPEGEATEDRKQLNGYVERHSDELDGRQLIRIDVYLRDVLARTLLDRQVWIDPQTHLPVRVRQRLQLGRRETPEDEYTDGRYDFPDTGPADIYALGAPADAPVIDRDAPTPADVEKFVEASAAAQSRWPKRVRVIQWPADMDYSSEIDIYWWDGEPTSEVPGLSANYQGVRICTQRFFNFDPKWDEMNRPYHLPVPATVEQVLAWTEGQVPVNSNISDGVNAYTLYQPHPQISNPRPMMIQVSPVRGGLGFNRSNWPTSYLWPLVDRVPPKQLIVESPDIKPGTILLRNESGNIRRDYHLDPAHDLICIKETWWEKREGDWVKSREYELSELAQLPEGQWYATKRKLVTYGDPAKNISGREVTWNVDVTVLTEDEFPPDTFNGKKMLEEAKAAGAKIETQ